MNSEIKLSDAPKPLPGWTCIAIGVGFIGTLTMLLVVVRLLGGQ